jgi:hypothetical protein
VVIADSAATPRVAPTPAIVAASPLEDGMDAAFSWNPEKSPRGPVSVVVSAADRRALVLRNGVVIGSAPVTVKGSVAGTWAYSLRGIDSSGQHWVRLQLTRGSAGAQPVQKDEWQKFVAPEAFRKAVAAVVEPGMTIVVTPDSLRSAAAAATVLQSGG